MEMTWICTWLHVIAVENLTACEGYESTRHAGANNVILLPENVNHDGLMNQEHPKSIQEPIAE